MNPESLLRIFTFILVSICCPIVGKCPLPSEIDGSINSCIRRQILLKNKSAFIGVDMETLRVMCSEFYATVTCLGKLVTSCPGESTRFIESRINSRHGFPHKELMHKLCSTQDLYEKYSIHYFCISNNKKKLQGCFHNFEKSIEPFVNSHDMTAERCRPVDSLMSCMESELTSCSGDPKSLLRALVGPLMPHGDDVAACPAIAGGENKLKAKSPEKTSPEHYKVLYDNNSSQNQPFASFVFVTCFMIVLAREHL